MHYWKYIMFGALGIVIVGTGLFFYYRHSSTKSPSIDNSAVKNFTLKCPGESSKCDKSEVSATNISHKTYSHLIMICKDKEHPDAPPEKPFYIWPFDLAPNETKCMSAVDHCMREEYTDKKTGKKMQKYFTLLQLDSNDKPIWMKPQDCPSGK